ncbi:MAG: 50S ribosomal protein L11 methyltransferase [Gammaproteobacteria bacterium]|nr:50S ribosomal protein L11 methyltransferase [Gammaproteobacteria bacterium]
MEPGTQQCAQRTADATARWLRLRFAAAGGDAEALCERLMELGALAATITGDEGEVVEPMPDETPLWPQATVEGLFAADVDVAAVAAACGQQPIDSAPLEDQDWSHTWRRDLSPRRFGRLVVAPSQSPAQLAGSVSGPVVRLDPGLAFGSGTHPTTALCLEWLASADLVAKRMLDVGSGSGILGIAALAMGAESVVAVDHDPQALLSTRENAAANGVEDRLALVADLAEVEGRFELIVANIVSGVLIDMAPALAVRLATDGRLLVSGILAGQVGDVMDAYRGTMEFAVPMQQGEWAALVGRSAHR